MDRRGRIGVLVAVLAALAGSAVPAGAGAAVPASPRDVGGSAPAFAPTLSFHDAPQADAPARLTAQAAGAIRRSRRHRFVAVSPAAVAQSLRASRVDLELFDGVTLPVTTTSSLGPGASGSQTWSGRIDPAAGGGDVVATITASGVRLNVRTEGSSIDLEPAGDGRYVVAEDQKTFPSEAPPVVPPGPATASPAATPDVVAASDADPPVIQVLTVYEDTAAAYFGSDEAAVDEITATINEMNEAYANSGISQTVESAGIERLSYTSSGAALTELNRLTNTDGYIDEVHDLRDSTGADLVMLVSTFSDACGVAWLYNGSSAYGYATVAASCARGNLSYAHELGHNMGAGHGNGDGGGSFSYSNGYRDPTNGFRTIMAYDSGGCCPRIRHFSSPTVTYLGLPTGSATQDNAATLNATAADIASYRSDPEGPPSSPPGPPHSVGLKSGSTKDATGPLVVSFVPPVSNGEPPVTAYWATCTSTNGGVPRSAQRSTSPITVTGATTGKRYSCVVKAENSEGFSLDSTAPAPVVVGAPAHPGAVKISKHAAGSVKVTFTAPTGNGAPVTGYTAKCTSSNGGAAKSKAAGSTAKSITLSGLTAAKTYRCTVTAKNSRGAGPASAVSNALKV